MAAPAVTVIGNFIDLGGNTVQGSAEFILVSPTGQQDLRIVGTGIFAPKIITSAVGTSFSVLLYGNDVIADVGANTNTTYTVNLYDTAGHSFWSANYSFTGSGTVNLVSAIPLNPTPTITLPVALNPLPASQGGTGVAVANANTIFRGPVSGGSGTPSFGALVVADLPTTGTWPFAGTISGAMTFSGSDAFTNRIGAGNFNDLLVVDGTQFASIAAAVTAAGSTNPKTILIPSTYAGTECPAVQNNLVFWDLRSGGRTGSGTSSFICTNNIVQYNTKTPGFTDALLRPEMTRNAVDATGSIVTLFSITHLTNATVTGGSVDGASTQAQIEGTLSGTLNGVQGNESVAAFNSIGGGASFATGTIGYISTANTSTTLITNAYGLLGRGCNGTVLGTAPTNCYGGFFNRQLGTASGRNYAAGFEGRTLFEWDSNVNSGGFDAENASHVVKPLLTIDSSSNTVFQAVDAVGLILQDSGGANQLVLSSGGGIRISTKLSPFAAGNVDVGNAALPFGNLWLGTAATNNFKFQPATTTGARIITIADPLSPSTVALPLTIGNGTAVMTTAGIATGACGTTVTVAATGVLTTDTIDISHNAAPTNGNGGNLILNWWPTAGNVNFNYCNPSAGTVTPTAMTLNWAVRR